MHWLEVDPSRYGAGDVNFYREEDNAPTDLVDPSGLAGENPGLDKIPGNIQKLGTWEWDTAKGRFVLRENPAVTFHPDQAHGNLPVHGDLQGLIKHPKTGKPMKVRIRQDGSVLITKGPKTAEEEMENLLKAAGVEAKARRIPRSGRINFQAAVALGASTIVIAGSTYVYDMYVDMGWEVGVPLAERVGYGRTLQILGLLGELPDDEFDFTKKDGTVMHVKVVEQDGQRYFTAWHEERLSGFSWVTLLVSTPLFLYSYFSNNSITTVYDIKVGQIPAYHAPSPNGGDDDIPLLPLPNNINRFGPSQRYSLAANLIVQATCKRAGSGGVPGIQLPAFTSE